MALKGFDPEFKNFVDYILVITDRIWEGRGIDLIRRWYSKDCIVRTPMGISADVEVVVSGTAATLAEFPDRRLLGEDVIWSGSETDPHGYLSSHRILSTMTQKGSGMFGPASGKAVVARTIADCVAKDNQIYEEWLVRDQGAIAYQVGSTPEALAKAMVARELELGKAPGFYREADEPAASYARALDQTPAAQAYKDLYDDVWNAQALRAIPRAYQFATTLEAPSAQRAIGHAGIDAWFTGYLASFPDAQFSCDHLIERNDPGLPTRVAMRWMVKAKHSGAGRFGAPTGAPIHLMGISHAEFFNGEIIREWILLDELAIWKQIHAHTMA